MNNTRKLQLVFISGAMLLFVALLFADTTPRPKAKAEEAQQSLAGINIDGFIAEQKESLSNDIKTQAASIENKIASAEGAAAKQNLYDSLIALYDAHVKPAIAAFYTEQKNNVAPSEQGWVKTGSRYYHAVGFVKPEARAVLYQHATMAYEKALQLQPNNLDAKTALAACYVEGSNEPMKGITMLREVLETDSNHVNALVNMGMFAIKSNQYEKAIERFTKIVSVDTTFIEAYLYLADCYERTNNTEAAITALKQYEQRVNDVAIKTEVKSYINKLSRRKS